jgi:hypothetical protein
VKQVMILAELEDIMDVLDGAGTGSSAGSGGDPGSSSSPLSPAMVSAVMVLARRVGEATCSPHFQVAERALYYWHSDPWVRLLAAIPTLLYPILVPTLYTHATDHWNK